MLARWQNEFMKMWMGRIVSDTLRPSRQMIRLQPNGTMKNVNRFILDMAQKPHNRTHTYHTRYND